MSRTRFYLIIAFFLSLSFFSCQNSKPKNKLRIATASNCQETIFEITQLFSQQSGIEWEIISASSGKLSAQIMNGAPYDIFISADMKYPEELIKKKIAAKPASVVAHGQLILWSKLQGIDLSLDSLASENIKHIAIGNPKTAPYGEAAMQVLTRLDNFDQIKEKLVYGENINQVNQFIQSTSADLGFTSLSTIKSKNLEDKGSWTLIDPGSYDKLSHGIVLIDQTENNKSSAIHFYNFMFSTEAQDVFQNYGYSIH